MQVELPPRLLVRDAASGRVALTLECADVTALKRHVAPHGLPAAEPFVTVAADGVTPIHGVLQRPVCQPLRALCVVRGCHLTGEWVAVIAVRVGWSSNRMRRRVFVVAVAEAFRRHPPLSGGGHLLSWPSDRSCDASFHGRLLSRAERLGWAGTG
eukprot:COSAG01_NODE_6842_length_3474_cov_10.309333_4_plen_155_part_00